MKLSTNTNAISKAKVREFADQILALEKQIKDLNDAKSGIYKHVKANYNASVKDGLQEAIRLFRMDPSKRLQADAANAYAMQFLGILEEQPEDDAGAAAPQPEPQGFEEWQAQRDRERSEPFAHVHEAPPHDAETGEILEDVPVAAADHQVEEPLMRAHEEEDLVIEEVEPTGEQPTPAPHVTRKRPVIEELVLDDLDIPPFSDRLHRPSNSQH